MMFRVCLVLAVVSVVAVAILWGTGQMALLGPAVPCWHSVLPTAVTSGGGSRRRHEGPDGGLTR